MGFQLVQLSTRHLFPNSLPRGAHSSYKCIHIVSGFGLYLPAEKFVGASVAVVPQFVGLSCWTVVLACRFNYTFILRKNFGTNESFRVMRPLTELTELELRNNDLFASAQHVVLQFKLQ